MSSQILFVKADVCLAWLCDAQWALLLQKVQGSYFSVARRFRHMVSWVCFYCVRLQAPGLIMLH